MRTEKDKAEGQGRRGFLKIASLGAVATAATAVTGAESADAAAPASGSSRGYRETDHVRKYYELARF